MKQNDPAWEWCDSGVTHVALALTQAWLVLGSGAGPGLAAHAEWEVGGAASPSVVVSGKSNGGL